MKGENRKQKTCAVKKIRDLTVRDVMETNIITVSPDDSLKRLRQLWLKHDVDTFPVMRKGELVGIVNKVDFLGLLYFDPSETKAIPEVFRIMATKIEDIMHKEFFTVKPDDMVISALGIILQNKLRGLPVVKTGNLVGFISLTDIIRCVELEISEPPK